MSILTLWERVCELHRYTIEVYNITSHEYKIDAPSCKYEIWLMKWEIVYFLSSVENAKMVDGPRFKFLDYEEGEPGSPVKRWWDEIDGFLMKLVHRDPFII